MDPISLLILIGLLFVGGVVAGVALAAVSLTLLAALLFVIYVVAIIIGLIDDRRYNKRVTGGEAPYRLPFPWRLAGWRIGGTTEPGYKNGLLFDSSRNRFVPIVRKMHG